MGNGCCCCATKVVPQSALVATTEVTVPTVERKEIPYGYVRLYAGVKTTENKYTSPIISLHTYTKAQKLTTRTKTTWNTNNSANRHMSSAGPSSSTNTDQQEIEEKVRCIPIEDIISIEYSTDVKKAFQTLETTSERARAAKGKLSCCQKLKECLRETFCCCPKCPCQFCKPPTPESPKYDTNRRQHITANRVILIEMTCLHHSNIDIPTHIQVLPEAEQTKFYKDNLKVDSIHFYLVNNTETDQNNFEAKRKEAERFLRMIVQLRNMDGQYPSAMDLDNILKQQQAALFGDEIRE